MRGKHKLVWQLLGLEVPLAQAQPAGAAPAMTKVAEGLQAPGQPAGCFPAKESEPLRDALPWETGLPRAHEVWGQSPSSEASAAASGLHRGQTGFPQLSL